MGILQATILEWVTILSSRGSSQPRDQTQVSRIASRLFTIWATRERFAKGQSKSEKPGQSQIVNDVLCHAKESALCPVDKKRVREGGIPFIWFYIFKKKFVSLAVPCLSRCMRALSCNMWDLVPPGIKLRPPTLGVQNLSLWTKRKPPILHLLWRSTVIYL